MPNSLKILRPAVIAILSAGLVMTPCGRMAADEESPALQKYHKPLEESVNKALDFLAKQQTNEGYWPSPLTKNTAVTSLSIMAFLAKGYTPGTGPYGEVLNRGIDFILSTAKPNGMLVEGQTSQGPMYCHAISTLMLSEVSGMVNAERQKKIDQVLPPAIKLLLTAQQVKRQVPAMQGGWRYQPSSADSDISCTGWALMSLRSARGNGAAVPNEAIEAGVKFVLNCQDLAGKGKPAEAAVGFCYQPQSAAPGLARTGTAVLCLELCGKHHCKEALQGGEWLLAHFRTDFGGEHFYYGLYYCSQAMFQLGGKYWEQFAPRMYEMMFKSQKPDGSWPGSASENMAGPCYATAMGVLAMSVSYRQLPIYQR